MGTGSAICSIAVVEEVLFFLLERPRSKACFNEKIQRHFERIFSTRRAQLKDKKKKKKKKNGGKFFKGRVFM